MAGSTVLLIAPMLKLTGSSLLKRIPFTKFIDEDTETKDGFVDRIAAVSTASISLPAKGPKQAKPEVTEDDEEQTTDNYTAI